MIEFDLPYPPSVNHYWRRVGARTLISRGGRAFRQAVCSILAAEERASARGPAGSVDPAIPARPPASRHRQLQKALLDALQHGGAYRDDSQIVRLTIEKRHLVAGGKTVVRIREATT